MDDPWTQALLEGKVPDELSKYLRESIRKWIRMKQEDDVTSSCDLPKNEDEDEEDDDEGEEEWEEEGEEEEEEEDYIEEEDCLPSHVLEYGKKFDMALKWTTSSFVLDYSTARLVEEEWRKMRAEHSDACSQEEQAEMNDALVFMHPEVVQSMAEDGAPTSSETKRAARIALDVVRPFLTSCAQKLVEEGFGFFRIRSVDDWVAGAQALCKAKARASPRLARDDALVEPFLERAFQRWTGTKDDVRARAWKVATEGHDVFPTELRCSVMDLMVNGDVDSLLKAAVIDVFQEKLERVRCLSVGDGPTNRGGEEEAYYDDEADLMSAARSSLLSDVQIAEMTRVLATAQPTNCIRSGRRTKGWHLLDRTERLRALMRACSRSRTCGADDTSAPSSPPSRAACVDELCRVWSRALKAHAFVAPSREGAHHVLAYLSGSYLLGEEQDGEGLWAMAWECMYALHAGSASLRGETENGERRPVRRRRRSTTIEEEQEEEEDVVRDDDGLSNYTAFCNEFQALASRAATIDAMAWKEVTDFWDDAMAAALACKAASKKRRKVERQSAAPILAVSAVGASPTTRNNGSGRSTHRHHHPQQQRTK